MSRSFYVWTEDITNDAAWSMPVYVDEPGIDPDVSRRRGQLESSSSVDKD